MQVWCRMKDGEYASENVAAAAFGFRALGAEIVRYENVGEMLQWLKRGDVVVDGVRQLEQVFQKFAVAPTFSDYPEALRPFLGRRVWKDWLSNLILREPGEPLFIKPVQEKRFTGRIVRWPVDLPRISIGTDDVEVYCSEVLELRREFRAFVLYDRIVDVRPYTGDYHVLYDPAVVDQAARALASASARPAACAIDFGVTEEGKTVVVEANDAYAIGCYGLASVDYARFLSARWAQLFDMPDAFAVR